MVIQNIWDLLAQYRKIRYNGGRAEWALIRENDLPRELGAPLFMNHNRRRTIQNVYGSVLFSFFEKLSDRAKMLRER